MAGAGGLAVAVLAPPAPATTTVLVAARDLPAGSALAGGDVVPAAWPRALVPPGALTSADGAVLAGPLGRGEPLTRTRTAGPGLLTGQPAGAVAALVDLPAGAPPGLAPGTRVDVLARVLDPVTGAVTGASALAVDVPVLAVAGGAAPGGTSAGLGGAWPGGGAGDGPGAVVVAVTASTAADLAAAAGRTVLLVRGT